MSKLNLFKPAVRSHLLLFLAGIAWICVGVMLSYFALSWLSAVEGANIFLYGGAGVFLALLVHHFGFLRIVDKNLQRILLMDGKKCLFAFIPWKSYLIIAVMMTMGIVLRHSSIPKQYLAVLYIGIGLALVLSSVRYMRIFIRESKVKR